MAKPENAKQRLNGVGGLDGTGLRFLPVKHLSNQSESPEEVDVIVERVTGLLRSNATWTDKKSKIQPLQLENILIVAPYNAQVGLLRERLPTGARVGTVDKFQGQEAPVVFYSMATSTPEDAPRGMEFLYSLHRLNVATSRARCVAILVASPALPSSALSKACQYALTLWKKLTRFLEYPELELSNNLAENSMRPVALGRKNWIAHRQPTSGTEGCSDSLGRGKLPSAASPGARLLFQRFSPGLPISRSGAFQTLLPLCGSPGIHRRKRPG